jgi:hypothetical protein
VIGTLKQLLVNPVPKENKIILASELFSGCGANTRLSGLMNGCFNVWKKRFSLI